MAYVAMMPDEKAVSAASFLHQAVAYFQSHGNGGAPRHDRQRPLLLLRPVPQQLPSAPHPPYLNPHLHSANKRKSRALHPNRHPRMGLRPALPKLRTSKKAPHAMDLVLRIAGDAVTGLVDMRQLLDVDVDQIAGSLAPYRFEHADLVQLEPDQDAADGGTAQAGRLCDPHPGPALPAQGFHASKQLRRYAARRTSRTAGVIDQPGPAQLAITADPPGRALAAEPALGCRLAQAQPRSTTFLANCSRL
jgi:hypothetical protein